MAKALSIIGINNMERATLSLCGSTQNKTIAANMPMTTAGVLSFLFTFCLLRGLPYLLFRFTVSPLYHALLRFAVR